MTNCLQHACYHKMLAICWCKQPIIIALDPSSDSPLQLQDIVGASMVKPEPNDIRAQNR